MTTPLKEKKQGLNEQKTIHSIPQLLKVGFLLCSIPSYKIWRRKGFDFRPLKFCNSSLFGKGIVLFAIVFTRVIGRIVFKEAVDQLIMLVNEI